MHKRLLLVLFIFVLLTSACSADTEPPVQPEVNPVVTETSNGTAAVTDETKQDSGTYVGQIDSNSIEIKISGVPEEYSPRAFRFSEEIKAMFDSYGLETNDQVWFSYVVNKDNQNVLKSIDRIQKAGENK